MISHHLDDIGHCPNLPPLLALLGRESTARLAGTRKGLFPAARVGVVVHPPSSTRGCRPSLAVLRGTSETPLSFLGVVRPFVAVARPRSLIANRARHA